MTLRYRVTLIVAAVSFIITLLACLSAQIRITSLLQRTAVSVALFSTVGFFAGRWLEERISALPPVARAGQILDIVSKPPPKDLESFDPFTTDDFERIERK